MRLLDLKTLLAPMEHAHGDSRPYGWLLSADFAECDATAIADPELVAIYSKALVAGAGMRPYGESWIRRFGAPGSPAEGLTLIQPIETSSLVVHFSEEKTSLYLDLFSCKRFDADAVITLTTEYFRGKVRRWNLSERY